MDDIIWIGGSFKKGLYVWIVIEIGIYLIWLIVFFIEFYGGLGKFNMFWIVFNIFIELFYVFLVSCIKKSVSLSFLIGCVFMCCMMGVIDYNVFGFKYVGY